MRKWYASCEGERSNARQSWPWWIDGWVRKWYASYEGGRLEPAKAGRGGLVDGKGGGGVRGWCKQRKVEGCTADSSICCIGGTP